MVLSALGGDPPAHTQSSRKVPIAKKTNSESYVPEVASGPRGHRFPRVPRAPTNLSPRGETLRIPRLPRTAIGSHPRPHSPFHNTLAPQARDFPTPGWGLRPSLLVIGQQPPLPKPRLADPPSCVSRPRRPGRYKRGRPAAGSSDAPGDPRTCVLLQQCLNGTGPGTLLHRLRPPSHLSSSLQPLGPLVGHLHLLQHRFLGSSP